MTVEEFRTQLENILTGLNSSGFMSIDSEIVEKLEKLAVSAGELGLKEGNRLIENLVNVMKAIEEGIANAKSAYLRLTALDFYLKKLSGSDNIEDL